VSLAGLPEEGGYFMKDRKAWTRLVLVVTVALCLTLVLAAPALAKKGGPSQAGTYPRLLPPWSTPDDTSYGEWSAHWWQWMLGQPASICPNSDTTGDGFPWGQDLNDHVLFLPGTWGDPITRHVTVPAGKALFFPLVDAVVVLWDTDPEDYSWAEDYMDTVTAATLTVDGQTMDLLRPDYRTKLQTFTTVFPEDSIVGVSGPLRCGTDGYYAMLAPLSVGEHEIVSHGATSDGFAADLTFHVTVIGR
jgi:hypothetical protein